MGPRPLRSVLNAVMRTMGLDDPTEGVLFANWAQVVGADVAAVCRVERLSHGKLFLLVDNSVWSYELSMQREGLRDKINSFLKAEKISEVHVKLAKKHGR